MVESAPPTEDYVLFADNRKALRNLNKRVLFMLPLLLLLFVSLHYFAYYFAHGFTIPIRLRTPPYSVRFIPVPFPPAFTAFFTWFPWFFVAELALLYWFQLRSFWMQTKPIVVLSSEGIAVDMQTMHLGLIYWNEIEEIRAYNFGSRYVGIFPKNSKALGKRLGKKRAWNFSLNVACIPLYKALGIFIAPINIPQIYLSISADELLTHIQAFQAAYSPNSNQFHPGVGLPASEDVWPPPSRREN